MARDIALTDLTGGRLHVAHVSTAGAVALLRDAKARGLAVTAEVTPHHLFLTEEAVAGYGTNAKMAPPLRNTRDVEALRAALADGTIDALATDHAPHHHDEKEVEFENAANGVVGLETALPLALRLVADGVLDLPALVARMTVGPARILGLPAGTLSPGAPADLTLVDPERRWRVEARTFRSKGRNTPFEGWEMTGRAVAVLVGGRLVYEDRRARPPRSGAPPREWRAGRPARARRWHRVSGPGVRRPGGGGRRARLQHQHDGVPGDPDGPLVRGAASGDDLPGDRQRRRESRGRRVAP